MSSSKDSATTMKKGTRTRPGGRRTSTTDKREADDSGTSVVDDSEPSRLLLLPEMILLHIFSFLTPREKCRSSRVCQTFRRVLKDPQLWKYVDLTSYSIRLQDLTKFTRRYLSKSLRGLAVSGFLRSNTIKTKLLSVAYLDELLTRCPNITKLTITNAELRHLSSAALPYTLEELHIVSCQLGEMWLEAATDLGNLSNLSSLDVSGCGRITDKDVALWYTSGTYTLRNLMELNLLGCYRLTDKSLEIIGSKPGQLTSLHVGHADFSHAGIQEITLNVKLRSFSIQNCEFLTDLSLKLIESVKTIEDLDISYNHFSDAAVYSLVKNLPRLKRISVQDVNTVQDEILRINPSVQVT